MKRSFSIIIAALILASNMTACGNTTPTETQKTETTAPVTEFIETAAPETDTPAPSLAYDPSLITENGIALAHIVLPDGASSFEKLAADELVYHLKLVTGADVTVTNSAQTESLPIIIATPTSLPELEELFPEDLAWLRVTSEKDEKGNTRKWTSNGFSIRQHEGKIYIFGATNIGAMNGVYDFIEENMEVIWIGNDANEIIYDEMSTVTLQKTDYREKSPFTITPTGLAGQRNKLYTAVTIYGPDANVKNLVLNSPIYDPEILEYWDTDTFGNHLAPSESHRYFDRVSGDKSKQINFWSQLTADTVAASVIAELGTFSDADRSEYYNVCMEDLYSPSVYPEMTEPFEYAPGQFIDPDDGAYISTVYFTFINRVARQVAEVYPEVTINTLAYMWAIHPPKCELESNVSIWYAPLNGDFIQDSYLVNAEKEITDPAVRDAQAMAEWMEYNNGENDMILYNYYFCHYAQGWYERPIWYRLQNDFQDFAEAGYIGTTACGGPYQGDYSLHGQQLAFYSSDYKASFSYNDSYKMNLLSQWIYHKLLWNPWEDVDALIVEFCDKVYGDASAYMQEYYDLLELSWEEGKEILAEEFNMRVTVENAPSFYHLYFFDFDLDDGTFYLDAVRDVLDKAYEAADEKAKTFIEWPKEVYQDWTRYLQ